MHEHHHQHGDRVDAYLDDERIWSGLPNDTLLVELDGATPSTVLDVGCGEGADSVWLAQQGWQVTAVEPSAAAIAHARHAASEAGVDVRFVHAEIADVELPGSGFALVSAFYPALRRTPERVNERALLDAVADGGELLWVHHATIDRERALEHGFDPDDYISLDDVREAAGADFEMLKDYHRDRTITGGQGIEHIEDAVLRLRRR